MSVIFFACCMFCLVATGLAVDEPRSQRKRVADLPTLSAVVDQLSNRVNQLDSRNTALENEVNTLKAQVGNMRCESGTVSFFPHSHNDDPAADGRAHIRHIPFSSTFAFPPQVTSGLIHLDADTADTVRVDVEVSQVQIHGFNMTVTEWLGSITYSVAVAWMACLV